MFDMVMSVVMGNMVIGLMLVLAWAKAEADMKKPEKRKAMKRLKWYKQHRIINSRKRG